MMLCALFSIAAHEGGHYAAARLLGHRPGRLALTPLGMRMAMPPGLSYRDEAVIAAAGPCVNLALLALGLALGAPDLAAVNLALAGANLLPLDGFDGGRLLGAALAQIASPAAAARTSDALTLLGVGALLALGAVEALTDGSASLLAFAAAVTVKAVCAPR